MNEIITSRRNPLVMTLSSLFDRKKRDEEELFLFEGRKLFVEAVNAGVTLKYVVVTEKYYERYKDELLNHSPIVVSESVYDKISPENSPDGIICAAMYLDKPRNFTTIYNIAGDERVFAASGIQNPGNLGTIIRTCAAFGFDTLLCDRECADIYNIKTVRAAMGALFRQRIVCCSELAGTIKRAADSGRRCYAAALDRSALRLSEIEIAMSDIFIVGNEGHGLSREIIEAAGASVFIPIAESSESLNASLAAAIIMYEARRR